MAEIAVMDRRKWLLRLIYVRLLVFTIFVVAEATRKNDASVDMLILLVAVYALSACFFGGLKLSRSLVWPSYAPIAVGLVLIPWAVHRTRGVCRYLHSLYFLGSVFSR